MVLSRAGARAALEHLLRNLWQVEDDDPIRSALTQAQIVDIRDILSIGYDAIQGLTYSVTESDGNVMVTPF